MYPKHCPPTSVGQELVYILFAEFVIVEIGAAVQWRPLWLVLEQSHSMHILELLS